MEIESFDPTSSHEYHETQDNAELNENLKLLVGKKIRNISLYLTHKDLVRTGSHTPTYALKLLLDDGTRLFISLNGSGKWWKAQENHISIESKGRTIFGSSKKDKLGIILRLRRWLRKLM